MTVLNSVSVRPPVAQNHPPRSFMPEPQLLPGGFVFQKASHSASAAARDVAGFCSTSWPSQSFWKLVLDLAVSEIPLPGWTLPRPAMPTIASPNAMVFEDPSEQELNPTVGLAPP